MSRAQRWILLASLVWISLPSIATALQAKAIVRGDTGKALEKLVEKQFPDFWGAVLVAPKGEIALARGFGLGKGGEKKLGADSLFDVGSASMAFTAVAVLELAQEKALTLEDPLSKWIADVPPDKEAITLRQLLQHSSGYARGSEGYKLQNLESREVVVRSILAKPLEHVPGAGFEYSDVNYTMLAAVVEVVSKRSFEECVAATVFDACKLESTTFAGWNGRKLERDRGTERLVDGAHTHVLDHPWNWGRRGVSSVVTSVLDLNRFAQALRAGPLLDEGMRTTLFQPGPGSYACGLEVLAGHHGERCFGQRGSTEGYGSAFSFEPEDGTAVIVLTRSQGVAVKLREALRAALLAGSR